MATVRNWDYRRQLYRSEKYIRGNYAQKCIIKLHNINPEILLT